MVTADAPLLLSILAMGQQWQDVQVVLCLDMALPPPWQGGKARGALTAFVLWHHALRILHLCVATCKRAVALCWLCNMPAWTCNTYLAS